MPRNAHSSKCCAHNANKDTACDATINLVERARLGGPEHLLFCQRHIKAWESTMELFPDWHADLLRIITELKGERESCSRKGRAAAFEQMKAIAETARELMPKAPL